LIIPPKLFHVTFRKNLESIQKTGLQAFGKEGETCFFPGCTGCEKGVYLTNNKTFAKNFVGIVQSRYNWSDYIITLEIDTSQLNHELFISDPHMRIKNSPKYLSYLFRGSIPVTAIRHLYFWGAY
jgi:RNA polymerase subunit RPABC4/transcription elongation factor Spt4